MKINYYLTYHAIERMQERFGALCAKYPMLKQWKRGDNVQIAKDIIDDFVRASEENRSFINNTKYMVFMYEKYGYNTVFKFLEYKEEDMVLVMCQVPDKNVWRLVTVTPTSYRNLAQTVKFNKTDRREVKQAKEVQTWLTSADPIIKQKIDNASKTYEVERLLLESVNNKQATKMSQLTVTETLFKMVLNDRLYIFIHEAAPNKAPIVIRSVEPASAQAKAEATKANIPTVHGDRVIDQELQNRLDIQLKYTLAGTIGTGEAKRVANGIGNPCFYRVVLQGIEYEFFRRKKSNKQSSEVYVLSMNNLFGVKSASN